MIWSLKGDGLAWSKPGNVTCQRTRDRTWRRKREHSQKSINKTTIDPPLVIINAKTFGFRSPLDDFKGRNYNKELKAFEYPDSDDEQEIGVTSPDTTLLQALASHKNFKIQDVHRFGVRFERSKSWNIGSERANTRSDSDSGASFDKLVETPKHQTNRALSSTKQQRLNTKHYTTTKIEH